jgi:hypothetical protein
MAVTGRRWRIQWADAAPWVLMLLIIGLLFGAAQIMTTLGLGTGMRKQSEIDVMRREVRRTMLVTASLQLRDSLRGIAHAGITIVPSPLVLPKDAAAVRAVITAAIDSQLGHKAPRVPVVFAFGYVEKENVGRTQEQVRRYGAGFTSLPSSPGMACVEAGSSWLRFSSASERLGVTRWVSRSPCLRFARFGVPGAALRQLIQYSKGAWHSDPSLHESRSSPQPAFVVQQGTGIDLASLACITHGGRACALLLRTPLEISATTGADLHIQFGAAETISYAVPLLLDWMESTMAQERFGALWQDDRSADIAFPAHGLPSPPDAMRAALIWYVGPVISSPPLTVLEAVFGGIVILSSIGFALLVRRRRQYVP